MKRSRRGRVQQFRWRFMPRVHEVSATGLFWSSRVSPAVSQVRSVSAECLNSLLLLGFIVRMQSDRQSPLTPFGAR